MKFLTSTLDALIRLLLALFEALVTESRVDRGGTVCAALVEVGAGQLHAAVALGVRVVDVGAHLAGSAAVVIRHAGAVHA